MTPPLAIVRADHLLQSIQRLADGRRWFVRSWLIAALSHAGVGLALERAPRKLPAVRRPAPLILELEPVMASPVPEPPTERPAPRAEPEPPARNSPPARSPSAQRPAAQAAPVLQQSATPEQAVDLTDAVVTGTAASFAGGTTAASGTGTTAVRGPAGRAIAAGVPNGAGSNHGASVDRSRAARVLGGLDWKCPFPEQANTDGVDRAVATIRVDLDASGSTRKVSIVNDPGHGFGAAARRCALAKRWIAALDRRGEPSASAVTIAVRFVR